MAKDRVQKCDPVLRLRPCGRKDEIVGGCYTGFVTTENTERTESLDGQD